MLLRAGADWRDLPFAVGGRSAREALYAFGFGAPFAQGRAGLDVGVAHARRSSDVGSSLVGAAGGKASESAWIISLGLTVRY